MLKFGSGRVEDPHIFALLKNVGDAVEAGDFVAALRPMDRVWRQSEPSAVFAHVYGRLLLHVGEHSAAVEPLERAANSQANPDAEADLLEALFASKRPDAAVDRLQMALHRFAVVPRGALARMAHRILEAKSSGVRGWLAVAPDLTIVGELLGANPDMYAELSSADGVVHVTCSAFWQRRVVSLVMV